MKILQVITLSELGGAQSVVINLSNNLCENHDVIVAAGEGDEKMYEMLKSTIKVEKCNDLKRALSPINDLLTILFFKKLYKKYKPDIIHLHSSKAGMLGRFAFPKNKIVYTVHGFDSIRLAYRKFLPIEKLMQYRCKAIVGVSQYDYNNLKKEGITNGINCVLNGVYKPNLETNRLLEISKKYKKIILSIARVSSPKRHDLFIETSKLLSDFAFVWIGNQSPIDDVPDNCFFLGSIPNAGAYCQYADIFMLPSNYEGLPIVILEAMSFGKPIVSSNVGGVSEIVKNDINGFTVENDPILFAKKIQYILADDQRYNSFCFESLKLYNNELTVDKMVERYLDIYKK